MLQCLGEEFKDIKNVNAQFPYSFAFCVNKSVKFTFKMGLMGEAKHHVSFEILHSSGTNQTSQETRVRQIGGFNFITLKCPH